MLMFCVFMHVANKKTWGLLSSLFLSLEQAKEQVEQIP